MSADIVGWIGCPLQDGLEPEDFLAKLKLRTCRRMLELGVPSDKRDEVTVQLRQTGKPTRELDYTTIVAELGDFEHGIPDCAECPVSGGHPLGCSHHVTFPVDVRFERLAFDYFVAELSNPGSVCEQFYEDVVSEAPASGTPWHTERGDDASCLAQTAEPLVHEWGESGFEQRVDSAQLLQSLFTTVADPPLILLCASFWIGLGTFAESAGLTAKDSNTLGEILETLPFFDSIAPLAMTGAAAVLVDA